MCFSAGASFGAAAVLGAAGIITIKKVKNPSQYMFASMPLIFGIQQLVEGFEWLSFSHPNFENFREPMMYAFLVFAQVLWPSWVPISIWKMEPDQKRKKILLWLTSIGLFASGLLLYRLVGFNVTSDIEGHHVRYTINSPQWIIIASSITYTASTLISPLCSSLKNMKALGLVMLTSLVVTELFYKQYLISVWCFFAAILSVIIFFVLQNASVSKSHLSSMLRSEKKEAGRIKL